MKRHREKAHNRADMPVTRKNNNGSPTRADQPPPLQVDDYDHDEDYESDGESDEEIIMVQPPGDNDLCIAGKREQYESAMFQLPKEFSFSHRSKYITRGVDPGALLFMKKEVAEVVMRHVECPLCTETINYEKWWCHLKCGHAFCGPCVVNLLNTHEKLRMTESTKGKCPVCRTDSAVMAAAPVFVFTMQVAISQLTRIVTRASNIYAWGENPGVADKGSTYEVPFEQFVVGLEVVPPVMDAGSMALDPVESAITMEITMAKKKREWLNEQLQTALTSSDMFAKNVKETEKQIAELDQSRAKFKRRYEELSVHINTINCKSAECDREVDNLSKRYKVLVANRSKQDKKTKREVKNTTTTEVDAKQV